LLPAPALFAEEAAATMVLLKLIALGVASSPLFAALLRTFYSPLAPLPASIRRLRAAIAAHQA